MSERRALKPTRISQNQSLAAGFTSPATTITYLDNVSYQINLTTSNSTGTFAVQGSNDYVSAGDPMAAPGVAGNWANLTLSGTPSAAGANDTILINLNQVPYNALRIVYTPTVAGTGTCDIFIECKGLS